MIHGVNLEIRRFYHVYVRDNRCTMTDDEIVEKAKQLVLEDKSVLQEDDGLEIEPHDILRAYRGHSFDDVLDDDDEKEQASLHEVYRYCCPMRPPSIGAVPKDGLVTVSSYERRTKMPFCERPIWGYVEYTRPLTDKEIDDYELIPEPK